MSRWVIRSITLCVLSILTTACGLTSAYQKALDEQRALANQRPLVNQGAAKPKSDSEDDAALRSRLQQAAKKIDADVPDAKLAQFAHQQVEAQQNAMKFLFPQAWADLAAKTKQEDVCRQTMEQQARVAEQKRELDAASPKGKLLNANGYTVTIAIMGDPSTGFGTGKVAINNAGQVVVDPQYAGKDGRFAPLHAILWNGTTTTDLHTLSKLGEFGISHASGINDAGQVAGNYSVDGTIHAAVWNRTTMTDLGTPRDYKSEAYAINNVGQVVGYKQGRESPSMKAWPHAALWNGTTATDLGTLGGDRSEAYAINDSGQVVGFALTTAGATHATLWNGTTATDLGTLCGGTSTAYAINNTGQVVGFAQTIAGVFRATLWNGTTASDLGTLIRRTDGVGAVDNAGNSEAHAINNAGQVVGSSSYYNDRDHTVATHATLWDGATTIDLNSVLDASTVTAGWVLVTADGINDRGVIVGKARNGSRLAVYMLTLKPRQ